MAQTSELHNPGIHSLGRRLLVMGLGFIGIAAVGAFDYLTGPEISTSVFYVLPIAFSMWMGNATIAVVISLVGAATWLLVDLASGSKYSHPLIPYWNAVVRLGFFLIVTSLMSRVRHLRDNLDSLVRIRTAELRAEVVHRKEIQQHITEISNQEQERLARELHDNIGAYLSGLGFRTKTLAEKLAAENLPQASEAAGLTELVSSAARQVRHLARFLAPVEATGENFDLSLRHLCTEMELLFGTPCAFNCGENLPSLPTEEARHLYRIAQEAARNGIQHGKASLLEIDFRAHEDSLSLIVRNDGLPFRLNGQPDTTLGLRIMRYRAEAVGGKLTIRTTADNKTEVICTLPLTKPQFTPLE